MNTVKRTIELEFGYEENLWIKFEMELVNGDFIIFVHYSHLNEFIVKANELQFPRIIYEQNIECDENDECEKAHEEFINYALSIDCEIIRLTT